MAGRSKLTAWKLQHKTWNSLLSMALNSLYTEVETHMSDKATWQDHSIVDNQTGKQERQCLVDQVSIGKPGPAGHNKLCQDLSCSRSAAMSMAELCRYLCTVNVKVAKFGWPAIAAISGVMMSATCSTNISLRVTQSVCGGSLHSTCTSQVATRLEIYESIRRQHIMALSLLKQSHSTRFVLSFPKWVRRAHHSIDQVESGSSDHNSHSQVNNLNVT